MNTQLLTQAMQAWEALAPFRRERERCKRYTYGRQWDDAIKVDGQTISEADYIRSQGSVPLKNNMIRRLVRSILGVWRANYRLPEADAQDPAEKHAALIINRLLECNAQLNRSAELYARTMEEFLISGVAIHRKSYSMIGDMPDCRTDYVHPDNFFLQTTEADFRGWEINLIGEIHNMPFGRLAGSFAKSAADMKRLAKLYGVDAGDMSAPCRVVEVWHEEEVVRTRPRWSLCRQWTVTFLTPEGEVLYEAPTPYAHGGHPYVVKLYPFIDGEIHSFVADVIDQQRYTNRLITLYDWIMRASAKGVLLFPEGALPEGADLEETVDEWSRFNGVILYRPKAGMPLPQQVNGTSPGAGITELLNIQLRMFEDVSGINSALQGKLESSSVSGTLYSQQTQNALISLRDLIESFREFMLRAAAMDVSNMLQYYTPDRICRIAGSPLPFPVSPRTDLRFS